MNQQILTNLDRMISEIQDEAPGDRHEAADAG
jgi:hypothetical protein